MQWEHPLPSCLFSVSKAVSSSLIYRVFSPKGSGEKLQDEESQEKISGPSRPRGAVPRLYLGWDFCPLRPKLQRTEKYTRIRLDRMQLDKMSKAHHFSPARAPGISG